MFSIIWILDFWLPDTCFLATNAVSLPGKLLSIINPQETLPMDTFILDWSIWPP